MTIEIAQVDAFADRPFAGNPAGVCILESPMDDRWMQHVAAEMNLSETAFVLAAEGGWQVRWFTPEVEVDLCGHATLATAHYLWDEMGAEADVLRFFTLCGELTARRTPDGWIELDFPALPVEPASPPGALLEGLGLDDVVAVSKSRLDYLVEVPSPELVHELTPAFERLRTIPSARGIAVTSVGEGLYDIVSRFFASAVGVDEDPATGSAHCMLGPYWAERLGKNDLLAYQASKRTGVIKVGVRDDRVLLGGQAVTIMQGKIVGEAAGRAPEASGNAA